MSGVNKVILVGHLGGDPESHRKDDRSIVTFSLATSESWKDKGTGERRERTEWHRIVIFSEALAKVAEQYLRKGSRIYLEGKNQTRKYTDGQGVERFTTEVVLSGFGSQIVMCDRASGGRAPPPDGESTGDGARAPAAKPSFDDEIPF